MKKILFPVILILFGITTQLNAQISALYSTPVASTAANPVWFFIQNATHGGVLELGATGTNTVSLAVPLTANNDRQLWRFEKDSNGKYIIYNKGRDGRFDNAAQWVESGGTEVFTLPVTTSPSFQIKPANNYLFNAATNTATLNAVASSSGNNVAWRFINAPTSSTSASPVWYQWSSLRTNTHNILNTSILKWTGTVNLSYNDQYWRFEATTNGYKIANRTDPDNYLFMSGILNSPNNTTSSSTSSTTFVLSPREDASGSLSIFTLSTTYNATDYSSGGAMGLYLKTQANLKDNLNQNHTIRGFLNNAPTINTPAGSYPSTQYVNITLPAAESAFIAYTTDGSDPTTSVTRVISSSNTSVDVKLFNFLQSSVTVTVKACAYKPGFYSSTVVSADYTLAASTTQWFYLQFANGGWVVADQGAGTNLKTAAKADGVPAQLWKIEEVSPGSKTYYLTSGLGNKISFASSRYTSNATTGLALAIDGTSNTTYPGTLEIRQATTAATGSHMNMNGGAGTGKELADYTYGDGGNCLRIVPLPAYSGNALNMNGINNYMRIPHNAAFNFSNTEEFSVTLWVNSTDLVASRNARIVAKRGDGSSTNKTAFEMWGLNAAANYYAVNTTKGESDNTALFSKWSSISANANTWVHLAFTVTGTGTNRDIRMYLNGQLAGSSKADAIDASNYTVSNAYDVFVGWGQYGGGYLKGKIDNLRFWNKGLSQSEVDTDQSSIVNASTANLIAAYDFSSVDLNAMTVADIKSTHTAYLHNYDALSVSNLQQFGMTGRGNSNDPILRATTVVSATDAIGQTIASPTLVNAILNLSGTTNLAEITSLKVYSTGSTVNFDPRDPITKGAILLGSCSPASGDITCTLSGTLAAGTHYLWVTADIANNAAEGNQIDIALKSITYNTDKTHTLATNNPTGTTNILLARKLIVAPGDASSTHYRIPSVITANDGSLLVFTDKRKYNNGDLPADIDVVVHRSTDNGKTWSAATTIATGTGVGAGFGDVSSVKTNSGKIIILFAGGPGFTASTASNPIRIYKSESTDNGITWTAPADITSQFYGTGCSDPTRAAWLGMFINSGRMLYTSNGRIMAVGLARDGSATYNNYVVYSDDNGANWTVSNSQAINNGNEGNIMELADGTYMVTSRKVGGRLKNTSTDGITWSVSTQTNVSELVEPGCNGDFIRYSKISEGAAANILLHSIPNNASSRRNVSVFVSTDEGATWPTKKSIVPQTMANNGLSGYSSLTVLPDGTIGAYVEVENYSSVYEMYFMNFSLSWLTDGAQTFTPVYLLGADDITANYLSWANSSNLGCGFGAWALTSGGNAGFFLGDPSAAGITTGLPNPSFALYANTTGSDYANADRAFVAPLSIGSTLSVTWGVNYDANGSGNKGINLYTGGVSGAQIININMGNSAVITINGNTMFSNYGTSAITLNFEYKSAGQLRVYATGRDGSEVYDNTFAVTGAPDAIRFYASGLNTGDQRQPYFNNLKIVTDPSKIPAGSSVFVKGCAELAENSEVTNLTIASGNTLTVNAGKKLTVIGTATNGGTIKLLSNGTDGTATLVGNVTGNAEVQQNLSSVRNWYMSSPVTGAKMPAAGHWYKESVSTGNWISVTTDTTMITGRGYITVPSATGNVSYTGALNNGDKSIVLTRSTNNTTYKGFNLVGNPYPSFLNSATLLTANSTKVENNIWYRTANWDSGQNKYIYQFQTYNSISDVSVPKASNGSYIPPMQAFWVRAKTNDVDLNFTNAMRKHNDTTVVILLRAPKALTADRQYIRLQVSNAGLNDELLLYSDANASNAYDKYDSPKMMNSSNTSAAINLFTTVGTENLVIDGRNTLPMDVVIPVTFTTNAYASGSYSISANELTNLPSGVMVKIIDNGNETALDNGGTYTFTADAGTTKTFGLILRSPGTVTGVENGNADNFRVFANSNRQIVIMAPEKSNYAIYNAMGQLIENGAITSNYQTSNFKLAAGIYVVKTENQSTRVIVK